jgi:hypothetical protein
VQQRLDDHDVRGREVLDDEALEEGLRKSPPESVAPVGEPLGGSAPGHHHQPAAVAGPSESSESPGGCQVV